MLKLPFFRTFTALLVFMTLPGLVVQPVHAAGFRAGTPPANIDPVHPTVSGTLIAKPINGETNIPAPCTDRDQAAIGRAVAQNRGLVICTEEGRLILLEISPATRLRDRDWNRILVSQMRDGDHINAWGTLRDRGYLLNPTSVAQDATVEAPPPSATKISGVLIAKPINAETNVSTACTDRDQASIQKAIAENRGLVICTAEGKLVLLEISPGTKIQSRYGGSIAIARFADGDHLTAWGTLQDNGFLLDPTNRVRDTDVQGAYTDSQDMIAQGGFRLTLYVLSSSSKSPVKGIVHAVPGGAPHIILCSGAAGTWADLTVGKTVDISRSLFNRRLLTYVDTDTVRVVSCP